jgi:hypothetical protein
MTADTIKPYSRLKARVTSWGVDEGRKAGTDLYYFNTTVYAAAPPNTFGDEVFADLPEPFTVSVQVTTDENGDNEWRFADLARVAGVAALSPDDLDRFDPAHERAFELDGAEVELLAKPYKDRSGGERIAFNFRWPGAKAAGKGSRGSRYGAQLAALRESRAQQAPAAAATPGGADDPAPF